MIKRQLLAMATATLLLSGSPALAADGGDITFAREVSSCIAAIDDHADYAEATRVRHTVVEVKNTFAGYVLSIATDVFTDSDDIAVREYATYCVAKGADKPKKFSIDKVSG